MYSTLAIYEHINKIFGRVPSERIFAEDMFWQIPFHQFIIAILINVGIKNVVLGLQFPEFLFI